MKKIIISALSLALSGCANQLSTNESFDVTNDQGLVAINMDVAVGIDNLIFLRMDPETCHLTQTLGLGAHGINGDLANSDFAIDTFSPGVWVLATATYRGAGFVRTIKYDRGSIAFKIEAGQFLHIGKLNITGSGATITAPEPEKLTEFMKGYQNVTVSPRTVRPWRTAFSSDKSERVTFCNPMPLEYRTL